MELWKKGIDLRSCAKASATDLQIRITLERPRWKLPARIRAWTDPAGDVVETCIRWTLGNSEHNPRRAESPASSFLARSLREPRRWTARQAPSRGHCELDATCLDCHG